MSRSATSLEGFELLLPPGERVLWSGSPDPWRWLARSWSLRAVWTWVGAIGLWALVRGSTLPELTWLGVVGFIGTAFVVVGIFWTSRASRYVVTDRRVAMRIGLALPGEVNIPLSKLDGASVRRLSDGSGDIALQPAGPLGVGYLILWPHARGWRFSHPEPLMRSIADVDAAGDTLRRAVEGYREVDAADPAQRELEEVA